MRNRAARSPRARKTIFGAFVALTAIYLAWRIGFTINPERPVYAGLFLAAEIYAMFTACVFYLFVIDRADRSPPPPPPGLRVDVFIATYNEEVELVRRTAVAARDANVPHGTWICDDGRRAEMKRLAEELGIGYLTRPSNEHYKSGNLNHALSHTDGDLVVVLDADHVVRRQFLERTIGYFRDSAVALVQTPQVYYNIDSYQHVVSVRKRRLWHEASIFHHAMQPGADRFDSAFFVGTGAVLRRSALARIGGFATGSITEDIHTSMRLHAAGYRSVYVDEALGFLLAPDTPFAYTLQRLRWAQGAMQILRTENPLRKRGLGFWQRIGYLNSLTGYLGAYQHLLFYLAPGLLLFGGLSPIAMDRPYAFWVFAAHILVDMSIFALLAGPHARLFLSECFKILNVAIFLRASLALLRPGGLPFRVTPKGRHGGLPLALLAPAILVFAFNLTAVGVGLTKMLQGTTHPGAVFLSMVFSTMFAVAGALALLHSFECEGSDDEFAFPVSLRSGLRRPGSPRGLEVTIVRLNPKVAYVRTNRALPMAARFGLDLQFAGIERSVEVEVEGVRRDTGHAGAVIARLRLLDLASRERDALDRFLFNTALPTLLERFEAAPKGPAPDQPKPVQARIRAGHASAPLEHYVPLRMGVI